MSHSVTDISGKYLPIVLRRPLNSDIFQISQAKHFVYEYEKLSFMGGTVASLQSLLYFTECHVLQSPLPEGTFESRSE